MPIMKTRIYLLAITAATFIYSCSSCNNHSSTESTASITVSPDAGSTFKTGDAVSVQAHLPAGTKADSIVYLIDSTRVGTKKDTSALALKTDSLALGSRILTAKVYSGGKSTDGSTNIVLLPSKAPQTYTYKVEKVYPHDTTCYTEGLVYQDGVFYESGGGYGDPPAGQPRDGQSSIRKVDLATGKVITKTMLDPKVFGEGISVIGDKVVQLTWKEKVGYVYDKNTLKLVKNFNNNVGVEGWGMTFDGTKLYMDDSTNRIWFLDKDTYQQKGYIDVYDNKGPIDSINELEFINGKIYANVFQTNNILIIDPKTGAVTGKADMTSLYPEDSRNPHADVLNGIAYDKTGGRIFVTGKKWDKLFQVKFMAK